MLIVRGRHARYRAQNRRNSNGRSGILIDPTTHTSNGEVKMKKIKMNGAGGNNCNNKSNNNNSNGKKSKSVNGTDICKSSG